MSETYEEIMRIDQIELTPSQDDLYKYGFKNGQTPLDEEHLGLLLSLIRLNYDNIVSLDKNQDNDHNNINSLNSSLTELKSKTDNIEESIDINTLLDNVTIDGGGAAEADPESFKEA